MQLDNAPYALTPTQRAMLLRHLAAAGRNESPYLEQIVCSLDEALQPELLRSAWERVVARHEALRTRFSWVEREEPVQEPVASVVLPWEGHDLSSLPPSERERRLQAFLAADRRRGFSPDQAPLLRFTLFQFGEGEWKLVWTFHHLIVDGRSFPILLREAFGLYDAVRSGRELAPAPVRPFRDHVAWLGRLSAEGAEAYWREKLAGFSAPTPLPGLREAPQRSRLRAAPGDAENRTDEALDVNEHERVLARETAERLRQIASEHGLTINTFVQVAWALTLSHFSGEQDVVFGAARACRKSSAAGGVDGADGMVGMFLNTVPVRVSVESEVSVLGLLRAVRADQRGVWTHEHTPLAQILEWSSLPLGTALFESVIVFDDVDLTDLLRREGDSWSGRSFRLHERTDFPLSLYGSAEDAVRLRLAVHPERFHEDPGQRLLDHVLLLLEAIAKAPERPVSELPTLTEQEKSLVLSEWNRTTTEYDRSACLHTLFERQVRATPDAVAVVCGTDTISYRELDARANQLAHLLRALGVGPDQMVGVCLQRSIEMLVALLAVHKAGGAYVPLDPAFPADRIAYMVEDAALRWILTENSLRATLPPSSARVFALDGDWSQAAAQPTSAPESGVGPEHLAYVIYTSGSTGKPKGVLVEHGNAVNFLAGMDRSIPVGEGDGQPAWLAVTSLSFDISVLELFWSLSRGFKVVLYGSPRKVGAAAAKSRPSALDFSLFYFASDEGEASADKYRLLLEGAKFADENGFVAVSTPERHFHAFGGLYPNPAVSGAAIAAITKRVQIRAGSVVLPLHHPIRIAEEWALVDNLSGGRVGISFASGWQPVDFVLRPENYADRQKIFFEGIETVQKLWRGDALEFPGVDGKAQTIRTLPRPVQAELPIWVTTAGSPETWKTAGRMGANVLTHLLGQSLEDIAQRIQIYRDARAEAGHAGPGHVTMMLHTFVGDDIDQVRETVRQPMIEYLRTSLSLVKNVASSWTAFKRRADGTAAQADVDINSLSPAELDDLLAFSFERYFETSGLFGTPESCLAMIERLEAVGVSEVACLIDFGVGTDAALTHLSHLNRLRQLATGASTGDAPAAESAGDLIRRHGITHLQCTPSMASMFLMDEDTAAALGQLRCVLIGGEAFSGHLARGLRAVTGATLINMYGPTETTVWSSTHVVEEISDTIPIGRPIANTSLYVLDAHQRPVPLGAAGELYIGGRGVTRGYHNRPELTAERFVPDRFAPGEGGRLYRTGDLVRYRADGVLEFLGRTDFQVKIRGYRIELGEIEAVVASHGNVREVAVIAREDQPGDVRLVAYVTARDGGTVPAEELRKLAREKLPDYMVPAHYISLEAFPQTPNRKIDRKALPAPQAVAARGAASPAAASLTAAAPAPASSVGPSSGKQNSPEVGAGAATAVPTLTLGEVRQTVTRIWSEVLGVADIGPSDNFFDLGGHSLLAVKVHHRLKEAFPDRSLGITDLFRFPTVTALSQHLAPKTAAPTAPVSGLAPKADSALDRGQQRAEARKAMVRRVLPRRGPAGDEQGQ
jgi:natural product biosynthesis luciferase-like monooxygenase protein